MMISLGVFLLDVNSRFAIWYGRNLDKKKKRERNRNCPDCAWAAHDETKSTF
jgi:hypothetical protein